MIDGVSKGGFVRVNVVLEDRLVYAVLNQRAIEADVKPAGASLQSLKYDTNLIMSVPVMLSPWPGGNDHR
jgi:hypothetical protein